MSPHVERLTELNSIDRHIDELFIEHNNNSPEEAEANVKRWAIYSISHAVGVIAAVPTFYIVRNTVFPQHAEYQRVNDDVHLLEQTQAMVDQSALLELQSGHPDQAELLGGASHGLSTMIAEKQPQLPHGYHPLEAQAVGLAGSVLSIALVGAALGSYVSHRAKSIARASVTAK
jgi:hypothetical protein